MEHLFHFVTVFYLVAIAVHGRDANSKTSAPSTEKPASTPTAEMPALSCKRIDDCSCKLTDGSGVVSMREIPSVSCDLFAIDDLSTVVYKPCSPFNAGATGNCTQRSGSVMCEEGSGNSQFYRSLATVKGMKFLVDQKTKAVTVQYQRSVSKTNALTYVHLVCDSSANQTVLKLMHMTQDGDVWHFNLTGNASCPSIMPNVTSTPARRTTTLTPDVTATPADVTPANVTATPETNCMDMHHCGKDLVIAVPVTAVGTVLIVLLITCCYVKYQDRKKGRYYTL